MTEKCDECKANATWFYMPGTSKYCDKHVPRGCECNLQYDEDDNIIGEYLDEDGGKLPCVEFMQFGGDDD